MYTPPAIIFVNGNTDGYGSACGDLDNFSKQLLVTQLEINETMIGDEFDARVLHNPNYPIIIHNMNLRILVIRADMHTIANQQFADVVLYVNGGLASIKQNNCGAPSLTVPLERIGLHQLLRYNNSQYTTNLPPTTNPYPYPKRYGGILAIELLDPSGVHTPNSDNEYNNTDFINRK